MRSTLKSTAVLAVTFVGFSTAALAAQPASDPSAWSVGVDAGSSRLALDCSGATRCDTRGSAVRLFGARQLTDMFGVEIGYLRIAGVSATLLDPDSGLTLSAKVKSAGVEAAATARLPLTERFALTAKLGLASMKTTESLSENGVAESESQRKTVPLVGVGLRFAAAPNLSLRADVDSRRLSLGGERQTATMLSAGLAFQF